MKKFTDYLEQFGWMDRPKRRKMPSGMRPPTPPPMTDRMSYRRGKEIVDEIINNGHLQAGLRDLAKLQDQNDDLKDAIHKILSQRIDDMLRQYLMR